MTVLRFLPNPGEDQKLKSLVRLADDLAENSKNYADAERLYRQALTLIGCASENLAAAHTNLGRLLYRRGDKRGALKCFVDALMLDGELTEAHFNFGVVVDEEGDPRSALVHYQAALVAAESGRHSADTEPELLADIHYHLGHALDEIGDVEASQRHWLRYIELDPNGELAEYARAFLSRSLPRGRALTLIRGGKK